MADDKLERLLRAWREDVDSEPFPVITDVVLPRQTRRRIEDDPPPRDTPTWDDTSTRTST
ncbi:hypothetical protein B0I33_104381 [Prauserella shujinwangii]|uniref:Uncharacterized protein n=1 Tax=Prauserella shujinwangii TaxID=1453103 RepID=A0A2T0LX17_9PSEU|nr:hypothetical protein [Prauserella shujinwangii]PRX48564.1 hypothetical protein B0I33_104381 [Prauserella shujinwangii]